MYKTWMFSNKIFLKLRERNLLYKVHTSRLLLRVLTVLEPRSHIYTASPSLLPLLFFFFFFMTAKEFYQASAKSFKKIYDLERFFIFTIFDKRNQFFGPIFSNQSITSVTFWLHFSETTCLSSENSHFKIGNRFDREPTSRRQDCSFMWGFRASGFWE